MRISANALHAMRALVSMKNDWPEGSSWFTIRYGVHWSNGSMANADVEDIVRIKNRDGDQVETFADIDIHDEIGSFGVNAKDFMKELNSLKVDKINLNLHSPGGEYRDGVAIYNALKAHPAKVHVTVQGLAASAASFIAMAGDHVSMFKRSEIMIHAASGCGMGNAAEISKTVTALERADVNIAGMYYDAASARGNGSTQEQWLDAMKEETWFTAAEAMDNGLIDAIIDTGGEDDDEVDSDAEVAIKNINTSAFASLVELAREAGYEIDIANKRLATVDSTDSVVNGKPEDQAVSDEPQKFADIGELNAWMHDNVVKDSVDNGDDRTNEKDKLRMRTAILKFSHFQD